MLASEDAGAGDAGHTLAASGISGRRRAGGGRNDRPKDIAVKLARGETGKWLMHSTLVSEIEEGVDQE